MSTIRKCCACRADELHATYPSTPSDYVMRVLLELTETGCVALCDAHKKMLTRARAILEKEVPSGRIPTQAN